MSRGWFLYYTILYYTILYYTILYYTILYYTILYYTILYYTILCYVVLYYTILYYTGLSCRQKKWRPARQSAEPTPLPPRFAALKSISPWSGCSSFYTYTYVCICMCIYMYACMYVCTCTYKLKCTHKTYAYSYNKQGLHYTHAGFGLQAVGFKMLLAGMMFFAVA